MGCITSQPPEIGDLPSQRQDGEHATRGPLHVACEEGDIQTVKSLLKNRTINAHEPDSDGCTPLHLACQNGHDLIVQHLLKKSVESINVKNHRGETPLFLACKESRSVVLSTLLNMCPNDINVNTCNDNGETPLFIASRNKINIKNLLQHANIEESIKKCTNDGQRLGEEVQKRWNEIQSQRSGSVDGKNNSELNPRNEVQSQRPESVSVKRTNPNPYRPPTQPSLTPKEAVEEGRRKIEEAWKSSQEHVSQIPLAYLEYITNKFEHPLGHGGYCSVYKGADKVSGKTIKVAVKVFREDIKDPKSIKTFEAEAQKLRKLQHPHIVRIMGVSFETPKKCIVLERASGGAISSILTHESSRENFTPAARLYVAHCLISAVRFLHDQNFFHRDIKTENLCMRWENWSENPYAILIDFGISIEVSDTHAMNDMTSCCGTSLYMAPEYKNSQIFTSKCDVFSIGCVMMLLLTADFKLLMENWEGNVMETKADELGGKWKSDVLTDFANLIARCRSLDPDIRPSVSELYKAIVRLREGDGELKRLEPKLQDHARDYTAKSSQTIALVSIRTDHKCIRCRCNSRKGILCPNRHFICSEKCLEDVARAHIGEEKIECPDCTASFCIRDLYEKVNGDVYTALIQGWDRNQMIKSELEKARKEIAKMRQQFVQQIVDVNQKLSYVMKRQEEHIELSEQSRIESIKSFKEAAARFDEEERRLLKDQQAVREDIEQSIGDPIHKRNILQEISEKLDKLSIQQVQGVKYLASGQLQCPRLFVLIPEEGGRGVGSKIKNSMFQTYRLHFLCAHDRTPVKTEIRIKKEKKWLQAVAPVLRCALVTMHVLAASYGIPIPHAPEIYGTTVDAVIEHMHCMLQELGSNIDIAELSVCGDPASQVRSIASEVSPEAYGAVALEAYKPKNLGWMSEMEIASYGSYVEWVKKTNVDNWMENKKKLG